MTNMTKEHLAKEAERLLKDDVLNKAIDDARSEALEALADVDHYDTGRILEYQATVRCLDELLFRLERHILAQA